MKKGFGLSLLLFASFANAATLQLNNFTDVWGFGLVEGVLNNGSGPVNVQALCRDYFSSTAIPSTLNGTVASLDFNNITDRVLAFSYLGLSSPFVDANVINGSPKTPSVNVNGVKVWQGIAWNATNAAAPNYFATLQPGNLATDSETILAAAVSYFGTLSTSQFLALGWAGQAALNLRQFNPEDKGQQRFLLSVNETPEPATFVMFGGALILLGLRKRFVTH